MRRWRILALICMVLVAALWPQTTTSAATIGQPVRVGLYLGSNAMSEVRIGSSAGLILARLTAGGATPVPFYSQTGAASWVVRPDAFRLQFGPYSSLSAAKAVMASLASDKTRFAIKENAQYFVRFGSYNSQAAAEQVLKVMTSQPGKVIGCYRVSSGALADLSAAIALRDTVIGNGLTASLSWSGSDWRVSVGHEATAVQAESLRAQLAADLPAETWTVTNPDLTRSEIYAFEGELQLSVPLTDLYLGATGAELCPLENSGLVTLYNGTGSKVYRGFVELSLQSNSYRVLLYLTMDQYVMGVVPKEMSYSWPLEALRAQAIIARTWGEANRGKHAAAGYDFDTGVSDQAYVDYSGEGAPSQQAVIDTRGMLLTYNGRPIATYYHSDSGGKTEAVENVWTTASPWLVSVPELYPSASPYAEWEQRFTGAELATLLKQQNINIGTIVSVTATGYTPAGRVMGLRFVGSSGQTATLAKEATRIRDVNSSAYYRLKSRMFTVTADIPAVSVLGADGQVKQLTPTGLKVATADGTFSLNRTDSYKLQGAASVSSSSAAGTGFVFRGSGNGHGVGLSQWGAYAMAKNGHSYEEILQHYFQGTEILQLGD